MMARMPCLLLALLVLGCEPPPPPPPPPAATLTMEPVMLGRPRSAAGPVRSDEEQGLRTDYPLHPHITSTVFWVGEEAIPNSPSNASSAWDEAWQQHFGGVDDPHHRLALRPAGFVPGENPFYVALPYNDMGENGRRPDAGRIIPWASLKLWPRGASMCKNRWVRLTHEGRTCYAQWEDVGPFVSDDAAYVFGSARPRNLRNHGAGIDVSPAVRDYLSLKGTDSVDWQFADDAEVPTGPWTAIVTSSGAR